MPRQATLPAPDRMPGPLHMSWNSPSSSSSTPPLAQGKDAQNKSRLQVTLPLMGQHSKQQALHAWGHC